MKKLFIFSCLLFSLSAAQAQYYYDRSKNPQTTTTTSSKSGSDREFDRLFFLSWDGNSPLSNKDFVGQNSNLGFRFGFRKKLNDVDRLWAGADFGWSVYKQHYPYQTYTSGTLSTTTELFNYVYCYNLTANLDYMFLSSDHLICPYAGLGVGLAATKFAQYYNIYSYSSTAWGLQLRPEVGVLIGFSSNSAWRAKAAVHYDYATNKNSDLGYSSFLNTGFQIGIVKMGW